MVTKGVTGSQARTGLTVVTEVLPDAMVAIAWSEERPVQVLLPAAAELRLAVGLPRRTGVLGADVGARPTLLAADVAAVAKPATTRTRATPGDAPKANAIPTGQVAGLPSACLLPTASREGQATIEILTVGRPQKMPTLIAAPNVPPNLRTGVPRPTDGAVDIPASRRETPVLFPSPSLPARPSSVAHGGRSSRRWLQRVPGVVVEGPASSAANGVMTANAEAREPALEGVRTIRP